MMESDNDRHNSSCAMNYCTSISTMLVLPLVQSILLTASRSVDCLACNEHSWLRKHISNDS